MKNILIALMLVMLSPSVWAEGDWDVWCLKRSDQPVDVNGVMLYDIYMNFSNLYEQCDGAWSNVILGGNDVDYLKQLKLNYPNPADLTDTQSPNPEPAETPLSVEQLEMIGITGENVALTFAFGLTSVFTMWGLGFAVQCAKRLINMA